MLVEWKKANTSSDKAEYPYEVNLVESIVRMPSYFSAANTDTLMSPWCFKWWVQMTEFVQSSQRFPPGMTAHWRQTTHCLCTCGLGCSESWCFSFIFRIAVRSVQSKHSGCLPALSLFIWSGSVFGDEAHLELDEEVVKLQPIPGTQLSTCASWNRHWTHTVPLTVPQWTH